MSAPARIGVLALQGGVAEHVRLLEALGAQALAVRSPAALEQELDGLVLPGGESSTMDRLLRRFEMREPLQRLLRGGLPVLGTCAGLILLAEEVLDPAPGQSGLGILDITVRRNAFGNQLASSTETVACELGAVTAAFIRAPEVTRAGPGVQVLARRGGPPEGDGPIVAVRHGAAVGLSFHPELTGQSAFHRDLLERAQRHRHAAQPA